MTCDVRTMVDQVRNEIQRRWPMRPRAAVILGTGLSRLAHHVQREVVIPFAELTGFSRTTALGHPGRIVCGQLAATPVILLDGRCHLYEGYTVEEVTFPLRVVHACGADVLIVSNASGGLNPGYAAGDVMIIDDHICLMGRAGISASPQAPLGRPARSGSSWYDPALIRQAFSSARQGNLMAQRGTYVAVSGPNYETRAEYRFLRRIGGDVVGMSTVPETMVAGELGMRVLGLSVVTNVASPDNPQTVDAQDVVDAAGRAEPLVRRIVTQVVASLNHGASDR